MRELAAIRESFEVDGNGQRAVGRRAALLDDVVRQLWTHSVSGNRQLAEIVSVVAVGGYGRSELFPFSDVDLLFCSEKAVDSETKESIRLVSQSLWDLGVRASLITRTVSECGRFTAENPEFSLALLDRRFVSGSEAVFARLEDRIVNRLLARDLKNIRLALLSMTRERHGKYGETIFHLEPNIKESPGGLRDANVCSWVTHLNATSVEPEPEFSRARDFLFALRTFLHFRHGRDDNTLDWQTQDAAADGNIGILERDAPIDPSGWMRRYFRHARVIHQATHRSFGTSGYSLALSVSTPRKRLYKAAGVDVRDGRIALAPSGASDPEIVLSAFAAVASTGMPLDFASEELVTGVLPILAHQLDDWPALWARLSTILVQPYAGTALRSMHALGLLELILPEFHGIDALVIRDAYHRYTVDEHTFVLIDVLHGLETTAASGSPEWRVKFGAMTKELHYRPALYLGALLHDTGKGRAGENHAEESARIARAVTTRLEIDPFDAELTTRLIELHLVMSRALRRDIFDAETMRAFATKVQSHELLRMLTVFTYADIQAVHPDALTPWKAENLWRLFMNAANQIDRSADEERIHTRVQDERVARVLEMLPAQKAELELFLEGFPERYLGTKSKNAIAQHFSLAQRLPTEPYQVAFNWNPAMSEITLVTSDKPRLFSSVAGVLAAKGMNVVSAEAFANASGIVVDTFRFTDTYRTLELNPSEREVFVTGIRDLLTERASLDALVRARRSRRRKASRILVETKVTFDETASTHSTLMQVVAHDSPGLLHAISETFSERNYNVEVALIDTEGETAIDVFYLTFQGRHLTTEQKEALREAIELAIETNATA